MIRWVFFDIGDVLFDEDAPHLFLFHSLLAALRRTGSDVTWDAFYGEIRREAARRPEGSIREAIRRCAKSNELAERAYEAGRAEYEAIRRPRPYALLLNGIEAVVADLSSRYSLGIIANQHAPVVQGLHDYGISKYFRHIIIDEIEGVSKPDPAIFRLALDRAGCGAGESIMVGDRPDNDIAPAAAIGMKTVRFRRGLLYSNYVDVGSAEEADLTVTRVTELGGAIDTLAGRG